MDRQFESFENNEFTNKFFWEVMPDNSWQGQPCYIIGGGPSLERHWPWLIPRLQSQLTIGINRAYEMFDPTVIFGMDPTFVRHVQMGKYGEPALKSWRASKAHKVWLLTRVCKMPEDMYILKCFGGYHKSLRSFPLSMLEGIGHGSNSGYAALNLAACLGANPIYLLGFDMKNDGDRTNWHDGYLRRVPPGAPAKYIKFFGDHALPALNERKIKVMNLNPESALECFQKAGLTAGFAKPLIREDHFTPTREDAKYGLDLKSNKNPEPELASAPKPASEEKLSDIFIKGPYGFGDTLYCRSLVKCLAQKYLNIYVRTTLPEAFWDISNVRFVRPTINKLRAQQEHIEYIDNCSDYKWEKPPRGIEQKSWEQLVPAWKLSGSDMKAVTTNPRGEEGTTKYFVNEYDLKNFDFSFPMRKEWLREAKKIIDALNLGNKKLCIIRAPTEREEWMNRARNPKPEYFQMLIDKHKDEYFFVSISNNKQLVEWPVKKLEAIDKRYEHGELFITTLFALIKLADMMITPPDLSSLLAIALNTKCFCIFGGCAKPAILYNENMGLENFEYVTPEPFCNCMRMEHDCNKEIPKDKILQKFELLKNREKHLKKVSVALPPGIGDMHWVLSILESFKNKNSIDKLEIAIVDRGPRHRYSSDFLGLIPFVDSVKLVPKQIPFLFSISGGSGVPLRRNVNGLDYLMEFNSRLEHGMRIEDILPEYKVDFKYPIEYPKRAKIFTEFIKKGMGDKLYLFYASSGLGNQNWCKGTWEPKNWVVLANKIYKETGCRPILIGAEWDGSYADELRKHDARNNILNLVGKTNVSEMLGLVREANFMVSFLSGITILATRFKTPCVSFWPTTKQVQHWHDPKKFQMSWIPPDAVKDGYYMPLFYGEKGTDPDAVFNTIRDYL